MAWNAQDLNIHSQESEHSTNCYVTKSAFEASEIEDVSAAAAYQIIFWLPRFFFQLTASGSHTV